MALILFFTYNSIYPETETELKNTALHLADTNGVHHIILPNVFVWGKKVSLCRWRVIHSKRIPCNHCTDCVFSLPLT